MDAVLAVLGSLVTLAVLVGWLVWLDRRLTAVPGMPVPLRRAAHLFVWLGVLGYGAANAWYRLADPAPLRPLVWLGLSWLSLAWYLTLGLALLGLVTLALRVLRRPGLRRRVLAVGTLAVVLGSVALTGYGAVAATQVRTTELAVTDPDLPPAFAGLRVALVTDLHVGALHGGGWTRAMVDRVSAARPDLVLLGGDLVDGRERYVREDLAPLRELRAPLGVYAVSGNHEFESGDGEEYLADYQRLGIRVLENRHVVLRRGGERIALAGVHDPTGQGDDAPDLDAALAGVEAGTWTMLLAHQPTQVHEAEPDAVDLQLSGHTHGGQLWPVEVLLPFQQPTVAGLDLVGGIAVVTSRGIGTSGTPVRVGSAPEVVVVTLRRGE